jgi:metal-sulfur cluster biosynthetic enzyme
MSTTVVAEEAVRNAWGCVIDPELGDNVVDLGMLTASTSTARAATWACIGHLHRPAAIQSGRSGARLNRIV